NFTNLTAQNVNIQKATYVLTGDNGRIVEREESLTQPSVVSVVGEYDDSEGEDNFTICTDGRNINIPDIETDGDHMLPGTSSVSHETESFKKAHKVKRDITALLNSNSFNKKANMEVNICGQASKKDLEITNALERVSIEEKDGSQELSTIKFDRKRKKHKITLFPRKLTKR
ncbi:hypothetical protein Bpfe_009014, partial [Biomphalaria pfeifferi]